MVGEGGGEDDRKEAREKGEGLMVLGDPEVTANLYCNFAYPYWEGIA